MNLKKFEFAKAACADIADIVADKVTTYNGIIDIDKAHIVTETHMAHYIGDYDRTIYYRYIYFDTTTIIIFSYEKAEDLFIEGWDNESYKTLMQDEEKGDLVSQIQSVNDLYKILTANDFDQTYSNVTKDIETFEYKRDNIIVHVQERTRESGNNGSRNKK